MIKQRVIQVLEYKGIAKEDFYKKIGMTSASFRGKAKESPLNSNAIANILSEIETLNAEWLLTGKGEMLKSENINDNPNVIVHNGNRKTRDAIIEMQEIPLYNLEATAGLVELFKSDTPVSILDTIKIPHLPNCDGAINVTGDSMYPLLKSGDIVMYKQVPVDINSIFFGEMYLLGVMVDEFEEMITVKYVQKSEREGYVKLVSQNQHHSPKDVPLNNITAMAIIKASIRINTML